MDRVQEHHDWEVNKVDRQMKSLQSRYDIVVIGAGTAGLVAAVAAVDNGASVLLLEKLSSAGGTLPISTGLLFHADPLRDEIVPAYSPKPEGTVSRDFEPAMEWLKGRGVSLVKANGKHGGYK